MSNHRRGFHGRLLCGAAAISLLSAAAARAEDQTTFNIAPQPLSSALNEFATQSRTAVLFTPELTGAKFSPGLTEVADAETALRRMLAGADLTYRRNGDTFIIMRADDPQSGSAAGDGADGTVEALIVTAQKREEDIQDVPIAISAFTQEDLTRQQIAGGPDLITQVPNMTFTKTNFSSYSVQLRGIGTQAISATTDPAVAVAFNNTPFIRNRFFEQEFYDLQRVEVLRGPQGTLYGRNATAGVVNIISAKPKFNFEAKLSGDLSNYNSSRFEGMINIPLVEDIVALRLAGAWTKRDGYATNELTGNPIDGRDLWSTRLTLRVSPNDRLDANLIWEHFEEDDDRIRSGKQLCKKDIVTEVLGAGTGPNGLGADVTNIPYFSDLPGTASGLMAGVQAQLSQGCERASLYSPEVYQTPNGLMLPYYLPLASIGLAAALTDPYVSEFQSADLRVIEATIDPSYKAKTDIAELQISFDLTDSLTITSETAYGVDWVYSLQDFNRFNTSPGAWQQPETPTGAPEDERAGVLLEGPNGGIFCDPQLGCSDRLVAVDVSTAQSWQFSQELRLASDFEGPFNFSLGANYLRADSEDKYYVFINSLSLIAALGHPAFQQRPYVAGVTDNLECMANGYRQGEFDRAYDVTGCMYIDPNPLGSLNDRGHNYFLSKNPYKLISYAVFGEAYYNLAENLKITAGLRWTIDKKEAPRIPTWLLVSNSVGYPVRNVIEQEWREPTGRIAIDWKPDLSFTDETMIYGSYARGYKAGGANPPGYVRIFYALQDRDIANESAAESETRPLTFDAEYVHAYELGAKNTLADGTVTLNLAAFYYDYTDYQISEIVDRSAFNRNFDAEVWGLELETDWRPLENLRLGAKVGYEETSIADGEQAIDLMDRTAGDPNWTLLRPFPTFASSCIVPTWLLAHEGPPNNFVGGVDNLYGLGGVSGGNPGGCELAYVLGVDPVTGRDYVPNPDPTVGNIQVTWWDQPYPGWDPSTAPNGGEGILKPLGGNELPNAPNLTATITADYTLPLPNEWYVNLHTDLHWQGESDWRVFQDHDYSQLDEYFTMNLAAIFTNEELGWNVMAYIKNVTDETAITGAFLNSDDTGLTTNVFLTEPRLYGLRVTKAWTGGPLLGGFGARRDGPYPFTIELGGQIQRHDAPTSVLNPEWVAEFPAPLDVFDDPQNRDLDWGDGREVKLTWRPNIGPWTVAAGLRYGKTNGVNSAHAEWATEPVCALGGFFASRCQTKYNDPTYGFLMKFSQVNHADAVASDREEHTIIDFTVGRDVNLGALRSKVDAGIRSARLVARTDASLDGVPDWVIEPEFAFPFPGSPVIHNVYAIDVRAEREFTGVGPTIMWEAGVPIIDSDDAGRVDIAWSLGGGVLFGKQETAIEGTQGGYYIYATGMQIAFAGAVVPPIPEVISGPAIDITRDKDVTVPTLSGSLGLTYEIGGFKVGAGYRWERYFNALDVGYDEHEDGDRTIDGPYVKLSYGFGG